jgi:hypothetical protein
MVKMLFRLLGIKKRRSPNAAVVWLLPSAR